MELPEKPQEELTTAPGDLNLACDAAPAAADVEEDTNMSDLPDAAGEPAVARAMTKTEIVEALKLLASKDPSEIGADEPARLKQQFYALHNAAVRQAREEFVGAGNPPEAFVPAPDAEEDEFKAVMAEIREKKAAYRAAVEREQEANLAAKRDIIAAIVAFASDADNVNRHYQEAKEMQARFKEIGDVPPQANADIWREYQDAVERFYDQLKINMELRDYDFRKNLSEKELLVAEAQKLADEPDPVTAFRRLQSLHDKWRLVGPVAKDLREEIWSRFKDASAVVNKRYQDFFEKRKAQETQNEIAKTALCERVEAIDIEPLKTYAAWDSATKVIIAAQEEWKKLGFASKKVNNQLFARFRQTCDNFFAAKAAFFKSMKEELAANLRRKTALAERAEALKESTEWRKTTDELVKLQKEWKEVGAVAKKHSDEVWKRFKDACDYFFEQKKKSTGDVRSAEQANLKAKNELIDRLRAITAEMPREEAVARLKEVQAEWPAIGHVPFREKDRVYDTYRALCDKLYKELDIRGTGARMASFAESIDSMSDDENRLYRERERMARACEARRSELHTYENNMGFLSSKSKSGDRMVKEMERKIERLREEIATIEAKIKLIDSKL